jgi:hypothetical protein
VAYALGSFFKVKLVQQTAGYPWPSHRGTCRFSAEDHAHHIQRTANRVDGGKIPGLYLKDFVVMLAIRRKMQRVVVKLPVQLAVGAGLIGKRHIEHINKEPEAELYAVVDPAPAGQEIASAWGVKWYPNFAAMISSGKPDGVIIATPNQMHVTNGLEAARRHAPGLTPTVCLKARAR